MNLGEELIDLRNNLTEVLKVLQERNIVKVNAKFYELERRVIGVRNFLFKEVRSNEVVNLKFVEEVVNFYDKELKGIRDNELFKIVEEEFEEKIRKALHSVTNWIEEENTRPQVLKEYSLKYQKELNKKVYRDNIELIREIEKKIEQYFSSGRKPGGSKLAKLDMRKKTNYLHADIPKPLDNHRIVYEFDKVSKKIIYLDIGTHKELGFGGCGS